MDTRIATAEDRKILTDPTVIAQEKSPARGPVACKMQSRGAHDRNPRRAENTPLRSSTFTLSLLSHLQLHYLAMCPSTPAENASQPIPPQAPTKPFVGSKVTPKYEESKKEASSGSAGP